MDPDVLYTSLRTVLQQVKVSCVLGSFYVCAESLVELIKGKSYSLQKGFANYAVEHITIACLYSCHWLQKKNLVVENKKKMK